MLKVDRNFAIDRITQTLYEHVTGAIYTRYNGDVWTGWSRMDGYGCATAESLASLLGVHIFNTQQNITAVGDGNQCAIYLFKAGISGTTSYPTMVFVSNRSLTAFMQSAGQFFQLKYLYIDGTWVQQS